MRRYILAPEAALDLVEIWRFLKNKATVEIADRVERAIREKIVFLARMPGAGHWRKDLTDVSVRFFAVYSYLIVYRLKRGRCRSEPFSVETDVWNVFSRNASEPGSHVIDCWDFRDIVEGVLAV